MMKIVADKTIKMLNEFVKNQIKVGKTDREKFYCFAERIEGIEISNLIGQNFSGRKNLFYFSKPVDEFEILSAGKFSELGESKNKFQSIAERLNLVKDKIIFNNSALELDSLPLFQCSVKFNSKIQSEEWKQFPDFSFYIPEIIFYNIKNDFFFIYNFSDPDKVDIKSVEEIITSYNKSDREIKYDNLVLSQESILDSGKQKEIWNKQIEKGKEKLKNGELKKFVLSRKKEFKLSSIPDFYQIVEQLKSTYPGCFIFLNKINEKTFFGASPESFIKSNNGEFTFEAVAGSVPRGNHIEEEISFEKRLLVDPKLKTEHEIVRDFIFNKVEELSKQEKKFAENSFVRKLDNIQHLVTKISVKPKNKFTIFKYIDELFPNPAVCGFPKEKAFKVIYELETHDRGLYSGLLGWFDINLNGELVVGIRSALSEGNKINAYAGGGILIDSDAEEEFLETELKFQPIISLFKNEEKS